VGIIKQHVSTEHPYCELHTFFSGLATCK